MGLLQGVIMVALVVAVLCIVHLFDRLRRLELKQQGNATDLVNVVNRLYTTILRPDPIELENVKAEDARTAIKLIDHYIGHRLFHHVPALRRVMTFSIGVSLDYLNAKAGITVDDLAGLSFNSAARKAALQQRSFRPPRW